MSLEGKQWHLPQTIQIKKTIFEDCNKRLIRNTNGAWSLEIKGKLNDCVDFVAVEPVIIKTVGNVLHKRKVLEFRKEILKTSEL